MTRRSSNPALHASEAIRARLGHTAKARREAIKAAREELPSYTDADVEEITGKFEALTETAASAAAHAAASATANALASQPRRTAPQAGDERIDVAETSGLILKDVAKVSAAIASIASTLAALAHWVLGWF